MAKIIGKFVSGSPDLPGNFDEWILKQDGYNERLGLIPSEVAPSTVSAIIKEAEGGSLGRLFELYDKMIATDSRIGGISGSLASTVSGLDVKVHAAKGIGAKENAIAADYKSLIEEALASPDFDVHGYVKDVMYTYFYGTRVFQVKWNGVDYPRGKKFFLPKQPRLVPGQRLRQEMRTLHDRWGELKIVTREKSDGVFLEDLDPRQIFAITDGNAIGKHDVVGTLKRVIGWWVTKVYAQLWWIEWVESYGQPMRIGRYPAEATGDQKKALRNFLRTVGRNKWGIFPAGVDVQLKESITQGNVTTFADIIQMASNEIAVALVGQTGLTSNAAQGSRAKDEIAFEIRAEIVKQVSRLVTMGFSKLFHATLRVNYGSTYIERLAPKGLLVLNRPEAVEALVKMFVELSKMGVPLSLEDISTSLGLAQAEAGELIIYGGQIQEMPADATELKRNGNSDNRTQEGSVSTGEEAAGDESDGRGNGEENSETDA